MHNDEIDEITLRTAGGDVNIGGTRKQGVVEASFEELKRHFGEPSTGYPKCTYHWQVRFGDGTVATIYDYYGSNRSVAEDETAEWSVGGHSEAAVELLQLCGLEASAHQIL